MDNLDLIKTVRGLDQNGPGDDGQNLQKLWNFLAQASDTPFHAADESSLRWLLKSMNGTSEAAETLRRYPLTWNILDCVFRRIPLFSLAKSLADRKFTAVLQQTLKDISKPVGSPEQRSPSKRKRSTNIAYSADVMRSIEGCLETARALFMTVKSLLSRVDNAVEGFSRDKIGAEYIKSFFYTSAADASRIVAPAFKICENLLSSDLRDHIEGSEDWIQTISSVWDLHLHATDDVLSVAMYLFRSASVILANVGSFSSANRVQVRDSLEEQWSSDMRAFMHRNFALPGRGAFINHQTLEAFTTALQVCHGTIHLAAPALYFIASSTYKDVADSGLRKDNVAWIKQTFQTVELAIKNRQDRTVLLESVLEQALVHSAPVGVDDLRRVCRDYAFQDRGTSWVLVSKIAQCETDVFQISDDGIELRKEICDRIAREDNEDANKTAIVEVIGAIEDGFRTRRDLPSFLRLWFEQLSDVERQNFHTESAWFTFSQRQPKKDSLTSILETEMSPKRLNEVVAWLKEKKSKSNPQAVALFASVIAEAVHSEQYLDVVGRQLFDLVDGLQAASPLTALRWRVVSMTASCVAPDERREIWAAVKKRLTRALEKSPILSAEAFEAFKCCYKIWDYVSPDGPWVEEPAGLVEAFTKRLAAETSSTSVLEGTQLSAALSLNNEAAFKEEYGHQQYIAWFLNGSSRFLKLYMSRAGELPPALSVAFSSPKSCTDGLTSFWTALMRNETNINAKKLAHGLVDRLLAAFEESETESDWPGENGQMWMKTLSGVPTDCFDRNQREELMTILAKRQSRISKSAAKNDVNDWKLSLGLVCKVMKRPTFYDGMRFSDLVEASSALSQLSLVPEEDGTETILEVIERFSCMASLVIKQMASHVDERSTKYFHEAIPFVSSCEKQAEESSENKLDLPALHMTLLKSLGTELARSVNSPSNTDSAPLLTATRQALSKCITKLIKLCVSEKQVLERADPTMDMSILAALNAAAATDFSEKNSFESPSIRKLEKRSRQAMRDGDLRAWKIQIFIRGYLSDMLEASPPTTFDDVSSLPHSTREAVLKELVESVSANMDGVSKLSYLRGLLGELKGGCNTDGQLLAIEHLTSQIIESSDFQLQTEDGFDLATFHNDLTPLLLRRPSHANVIFRILRGLLERRPQSMSQWNIELTLSTVSRLASGRSAGESTVSYPWLCKLVEVIIKKHRLRLEGRFHLLLSTMQILLQNLIMNQHDATTADSFTQEAKAQLYARLITLICEPTAGAVSRSQLRSSLDPATDAAKRSAGRHMYLVLVRYVKLQLETSVSAEVRDALEQAMNSIFDITSPEGRKILNDAMDSSGRAILREMFKRYVKFGKWSGA
ncbi:Nucleolar 27S pre-rRNA processing, Urb2/Npa2 [Metarhizium album ARSEF 1941]|uniref:Nucleolar 27S pre-rRNA processing, Urb2/Npa2 n=1 Tax=Metarhizium album (strain ARSEF 1941) TaxID=1081103 RepID=A0A0B2X2Z7_METAS|nr:Nucleolar 27S pre-rRNA processing, Urb2/Npa2 [Metarhizium album ARSEF 1941]KHN99680.1 Nucleolar 27S pre-rRNA processing, Urb2/Npa2 [Metarhizium album ARSEF 1941]